MPANQDVTTLSNPAEDILSTDSKPSVDISMLISLVGDSKDSHCLLFKSFSKEALEIIQEIQSAYQERGANEIRHLAHRLKSSANSLGASKLAKVLSELEATSSQNRWGEIDRLIPLLDGLLNDVSCYIENYCGTKPTTNPIYQQLKSLVLERDVDSTGSTGEQLEVISSRAEILIAEDNLTNQRLFLQQLQLLGLRANFVDNGVKAWDRLQNKSYDFLFTDIDMPLMDGLELVRLIRQAEQKTGESMPIIAYTANTTADDKKRCLESGMDAVLAKPVVFSELKKVLKKYLPR